MVSKWSQFTPGVHSGARTSPSIQDSPQLATVLKVTTAGAWFELDATPKTSYGPAPWGLGSYATRADAITAGYKPLLGDRALVVFAGVGIENPVVLSWWRS